MPVNVVRILVTDGINEQCAQILRNRGLHVTVVVAKMTSEEIIRRLKTHDALLVRSATKVTAEIIEASPGLKLIGRAGTGVDNIDVDAATRHGVLVMNTPGGNTLSAAEHTCVMIASLSRNLPAACASLKAGKWERSKFMGSEMYGKTLAVLGLGRIGREVAQRMRAFGMRVIGFDPMVSAEAAQEFHVEKRELDEIWPEADYITVHTPLIPQTKNLINADALSRCKHGVRIINVARGGIVDEAALLNALKTGRCGGAGLDVFAEEPPTNLALVQHPATICTPHLGANTREAQQRVARELAEQVASAAQSGTLVGLVNAPNLNDAMRFASRPWLWLSRALGTVAGMLAGVGSGKPFELQLTLNGPDMDAMQSFLISSVLVGLMAGMTPNGVNLINAPMLAHEAGIRVSVTRDSAATPAHTIGVRITLDGQEHSVVGELQGEQSVLVQLDRARFESGVTLGGNVLFFKSDGSGDALMPIITALVSARAELLTVMASGPEDTTPLIAVRTLDPVHAPEKLPTSHAKFLLQTYF
ncbi:D-3-phosphoglycerate dehydrogenase-like [Pollicipes pollicipes]|uniref:D-3-phosphoglycerate dehydrogenase-like n=1 Tax=Pollicipes pollicipes TaxID=41117 RepID=UPI001884B74B|nr:D-3-phosphoglycerate dehydrogenase-like [Pollicipes pollicipes]